MSRLRERVRVIVFEADTPAGKWFDILLIAAIVMSVLAVMLNTVESVKNRIGGLLDLMEWFFTVLFSCEYLVRLYCTKRPAEYARSFFGVVDLLAVLPSYLSILVPGSQYFLAIRVLRVLRMFRVLKLARFMSESHLLLNALKASARKIVVFLFAVLTIVVVLGSMMYLIEGRENGFTSIPASVYWSIVTLTTVGYGDISPGTPLGQALASVIMILGYGIIAVPTGIVSAEMVRSAMGRGRDERCAACGAGNHDLDAKYCRVCGKTLKP